MASITHTPVTITDHEPVELGAEKAGLYSVTIFANELSRDGVSVDIDGMDFSNYRKNPVVLFAHDYSGKTGSSGLPIGRTLRLGCTRDGRIKADFEFLSGDPFADRVRNAWNRGFLRCLMQIRRLFRRGLGKRQGMVQASLIPTKGGPAHDLRPRHLPDSTVHHCGRPVSGALCTYQAQASG